MNRHFRLLGLGLLLSAAGPAAAQQLDARKALKAAEKQYRVLQVETDKARRSAKPGQLTPRTGENGQLKLVGTPDWTSGFYPASLWYLYELTRKPAWLRAARAETQCIEPEQHNTTTHDLGFMVYGPAGHALRLTQDAHYRAVIIQAARSLSTRFNPRAGVIRSWDQHKDSWQFPVIIDNMMNLELLFEATRLSGDSTFWRVAVTHANTTLRHHFRPDNSSCHVVDYDPQTGAVRGRHTAQGYADESAWARGQAWGLYGYTLCYRYTRHPAYLAQAERIAAFILRHPNLPADRVPYWDYNAPDLPTAPRDASAAAIAASALYELAGYAPAQAAYYRQQADATLRSLSRQYTAPAGQHHGFLLLHSTGHKPAGSEIDVPICYADYYYLEALLRARQPRP
ncbi:glucuronyl hydrolase [Hymenobacter gummosus]|uniref:Glucuronyl hydrolase n=1 Tax=Hymenobacter gummosus TaxID=1776032 RepID=A0A3S0H999_9BACT|nr:glycoside hydrolase family 88 protein [Hymenobacter gummosus]RTQ49684.1 glucuronyl hydrolase [Hymenobacter gummosus]